MVDHSFGSSIMGRGDVELTVGLSERRDRSSDSTLLMAVGVDALEEQVLQHVSCGLSYASLKLNLRRIRSLLEDFNRIKQADEFLSQGTSLNQEQKQELSLKPRSLDANMNTSMIDRVCLCQKRSNLNEKPVGPQGKERRYLCVTDGFTIYCLDLKQGKDESKDFPQPLPIVGTLELLESGLPISAGLFKLGSDAYMVSGQEFPGFKEHPELKLPHGLYEKYDLKGSSRKTYHLSLDVDGVPCLSQCYKTPLLKKPKFWPIVEKIGNQIHVIESIPRCFKPPRTIPSHEVINCDDFGRGWKKVSPPEKREGEGAFMIQHLVVGDRWIYAKEDDRSWSKYFVFDCESNKWELHPRPPMHVTYAFGFQYSISVGAVQKAGCEDPLYVVIGFDNLPRPGGDVEIFAVAYLVTATGKIFCSQDLPHLLDSAQPANLVEANVFRVDDTEDFMCVILLEKEYGVELVEVLYTSTFSVVLAAVDQGDDFVKVVVKDTHMYQVGDKLRARGDEETYPPRLSACFL